ncbi:MAG TPA: hypothetical protein ACFE0H_12125 [Elainellaceae cyanobacterium]
MKQLNLSEAGEENITASYQHFKLLLNLTAAIAKDTDPNGYINQ